MTVLNVTELHKHIGLSVVLIGFGNLRIYGSAAAQRVFAIECLYKQLYPYVPLEGYGVWVRG